MKAFPSQFASAGLGVTMTTKMITTTTKTISSTVKSGKSLLFWQMWWWSEVGLPKWQNCATFLDPSATLELDIEGNL